MPCMNCAKFCHNGGNCVMSNNEYYTCIAYQPMQKEKEEEKK